MRLKKHFSALLVERNIANVGDIEAGIEQMIKDKRPHTKIQKWLRTVYRNWLINDYGAPGVQLTKLKQAGRGAEPWLKNAIERGDDVYLLKVPSLLTQQMLHVVDWMEHAIANRQVRDLSRISVRQTWDHVADWERERKKRLEKQSEAGTVKELVALKNGFKLVKLLDQEAYKWESKHMSHCVADSYSPSKYDETNDAEGILSIRDKNNKPHVTIEVDNGIILQVKGHGNDPVPRKYMGATLEALNSKLLKNAMLDVYEATHNAIVETTNGTMSLFDVKPGSKIFTEVDLNCEGHGLKSFVMPRVEADYVDVHGLKDSFVAKAGSAFTMLNVSVGGHVRTDGTIEIDRCKSNDFYLKADLIEMDGCYGNVEATSEGQININDHKGSRVIAKDNGAADRPSCSLTDLDTKLCSAKDFESVVVGGRFDDGNFFGTRHTFSAAGNTVCKDMHVSMAKHINVESGAQIDELVLEDCYLGELDLRGSKVKRLVIRGGSIDGEILLGTVDKVKFEMKPTFTSRSILDVKKAKKVYVWETKDGTPLRITKQSKIGELSMDGMYEIVDLTK